MMEQDQPQFPKPKFRPAEIVSAQSCEDVFASGDFEAIQLALVDGSRCLDEAWSIRWGTHFLKHNSPIVRWGAIFALDQGRMTLMNSLRDDFEVIHSLAKLANSDPDEKVRYFAVSTLVDIVGVLVDREH